MTAAILVFCTCPDESSADRLAEALVAARLAACVNRLPAVASTYRWQGRICRSGEHLLMIKTTKQRFSALRERIVALHPYDVPEVIALDIVAGLETYLAWIGAETRDDAQG